MQSQEFAQEPVGARARVGATGCCAGTVGILRHALFRTPSLQRLEMSQLGAAPLRRIDGSSGEIARHSESIQARRMWRGRGAIIFAVRRAGCSMCREQALDLSALLSELADELDGVAILAVVKPSPGAPPSERVALSEFATKYFPRGEVYEDATISVFRALGRRGHVRRLSLPSALWFMASKKSRRTALGLRLHERGVINNEPTADMGEAPLVQGGVLILAGGNETNIEYRYPERTGDVLPIEQIRTALRGLPRPIVWPPQRSEAGTTTAETLSTNAPAGVERARSSRQAQAGVEMCGDDLCKI